MYKTFRNTFITIYSFCLSVYQMLYRATLLQLRVSKYVYKTFRSVYWWHSQVQTLLPPTVSIVNTSRDHLKGAHIRSNQNSVIHRPLQYCINNNVYWTLDCLQFLMSTTFLTRRQLPVGWWQTVTVMNHLQPFHRESAVAK